LLRNLGPNPGRLVFVDAPELTATVVASRDPGEHEIEINADDSARLILDRIGRMPLPPYIKREKVHDPRDRADRERYQTVYAQATGAVAAATAGLHFTHDLLSELLSRGIEQAFVTLHVGLGTFKPVTTQTLEAHPMHAESYEISEAAADALNRPKRERR